MSYNLIHDESQLREFLHLFFNETPPKIRPRNHVKIMMLVSREKYMSIETKQQIPPMKNSSHKISLTPLPCYQEFDYYVNEIRKLEVKKGCYTYKPMPSKAKKNDLSRYPIPLDSLVLYLDLHTKSMLSAFLEVSAAVNQEIQHAFHNESNIPADQQVKYTDVERTDRSIIATAHRAKHAKKTCAYHDLDLDTKDSTLIRFFIDQTFTYLEACIKCIIETFGGFHIVLEASKLGTNHSKLYAFLKEPMLKIKEEARNGEMVDKTWLCLNESPQVPVVGCLQGTFPVHFVSIDDFKKLVLRCNEH